MTSFIEIHCDLLKIKNKTKHFQSVNFKETCNTTILLILVM
jgi:hypothetical protein